MEYPPYNKFVKDVPEYVDEVRRIANMWEIDFDKAMEAAQKSLDEWHEGSWGDMTRDPSLYFIESALSYLDPFNERVLMDNARNLQYKAALKSWARQGNYKVSEVWEWFDSVIEKYKDIDHIPHSDKDDVWGTFKRRFPIAIPHDAEGNVDPTALSEMDELNRALVTAQSAEVAHTCATGGGDDTWFDYLPAGIDTLQALQAEDWAAIFAEYINTMKDVDEEAEWANMNESTTEERLPEKFGFYIMDVTSPLVYIFLEG